MNFTLRWYGDKVEKAFRAKGAKGLFLAAEHILEEATRRVPLDEGTLMASGEVSLSCSSAGITVAKDGTLHRHGNPAYDGRRVEAVISYDTPYAARLHERGEGMRFQQGREDKWLEKALKDRAGAVNEFLARGFK